MTGGSDPEREGHGFAAEAAALVERLRADLRERLAGMDRDMERMMAASLDSNADDEHDPEGQTIAYERAQLASLTAGLREHLAELDDAAARIAEGTYGRCAVCGEPIAAGRLEARPAARTCVVHAR
ncbi:TraR/DksA C4-type zinc finger protein [Nostocoides sp. Soil756]|uniref:TraR/DksA family transcriptional regulator n=1 Tax=Nostocoides sp. Soil756 TaxID=1736399 RepID=UPI000AAA3957